MLHEQGAEELVKFELDNRKEFNNGKTFLRDDMVYISYNALNINIKGKEEILLEKLISNGVVSCIENDGNSLIFKNLELFLQGMNGTYTLEDSEGKYKFKRSFLGQKKILNRNVYVENMKHFDMSDNFLSEITLLSSINENGIFFVGHFRDGNIEEYIENEDYLENQIVWLDEPRLVLPKKIKHDEKTTYGNGSIIVKKVDIEIEGQKYKDIAEIKYEEENYPSTTSYFSMYKLIYVKEGDTIIKRLD